MADDEGLTSCQSKNLQAPDGEKGIAYAANEWCGFAIELESYESASAFHAGGGVRWGMTLPKQSGTP